MGTKTGIAWTDATWNPIRGCSVVSEGCKNCYAMAFASRFSGEGQPYEALAFKTKDGHAHWTGEIMLVDKHLTDPLKWRDSKRVFVNSMSDLFHETMMADHQDYIDRVFAVMTLSSKHIFQVLTKRPHLMREYVSAEDTQQRIWEQCTVLSALIRGTVQFEFSWPLPNVWLGTSTENQQRYDERYPYLAETPAAVRFLSCEPLLGPIYLKLGYGAAGEPMGVTRGDLLHWVITGGESGPHYREMDLEWVRSIRDECVEAGVAFFHKQGSGRYPGQNTLLDGVEYHQFPKVAA